MSGTDPRRRRRVPQTQAERSKRARERRAAKRSCITQGLAAALRALTADPADPATPDLVDALAAALAGLALDLHQRPGETDEDAGIRAAVRALHDAYTDLLDGPAEATGAIARALKEVDAGTPTSD